MTTWEEVHRLLKTMHQLGYNVYKVEPHYPAPKSMHTVFKYSDEYASRMESFIGFSHLDKKGRCHYKDANSFEYMVGGFEACNNEWALDSHAFMYLLKRLLS